MTDELVAGERRCAVCAESLDGMRSDARSCSDACKQAAYRIRVAAREELELQALARIARRAVRSGELDGLDVLGLVVASPLAREALRARLEAPA